MNNTIAIFSSLISGVEYSLSAVVNAVGGNTTYTGIFLIPVQAQAMVLIAGWSTPANNGTFSVVSCDATTLVVNNSAGVAETHVAIATIQGPFSTDGYSVLRGEGIGVYPVQGALCPVLSMISANPDTLQLVLNEEGNSIDSVFFNVFTGPDGAHGFQIGACYDGTGNSPSFFEMAWEGGPFIGLLLPDETTGLWVSSNAMNFGSGYEATISLQAGQSLGVYYTLTLDSIAGLTCNSPAIFADNFQANTLACSGPTPTGGEGIVSFGTTTALTAGAGTNGATPAQVAGYLEIDIAGTKYKLPYYPV
jgi:hypothetical protein